MKCRTQQLAAAALAHARRSAYIASRVPALGPLPWYVLVLVHRCNWHADSLAAPRARGSITRRLLTGMACDRAGPTAVQAIQSTYLDSVQLRADHAFMRSAKAISLYANQLTRPTARGSRCNSGSSHGAGMQRALQQPYALPASATCSYRQQGCSLGHSLGDTGAGAQRTARCSRQQSGTNLLRELVSSSAGWGSGPAAGAAAAMRATLCVAGQSSTAHQQVLVCWSMQRGRHCHSASQPGVGGGSHPLLLCTSSLLLVGARVVHTNTLIVWRPASTACHSRTGPCMLLPSHGRAGKG